MKPPATHASLFDIGRTETRRRVLVFVVYGFVSRS